MKCPAGKCECVHYDTELGDHKNWCKAVPSVNRLIDGYECCPWESKILAPSKGPNRDCAEELFKFVYGDGPHREKYLKEFTGILKKHFLNKGDVDKAWATFWDLDRNDNKNGVRSNIGQFQKALKDGGFIK